MISKTNLLGFACTAALITPLMSAPAFAQNGPAASDDAIVVTGSRIKKTPAQSPVPVQMLGAVDLEELGTNDLAEGLIEIPGIGDGVSQRGSNNNIQTAGLSTISLRRLGDDRTLVLINGKRAVSNSGNSDRVSLSTIAPGMVKRTEVVTGGFSAQYGSDAIAGVANFILEDDFEGFEADISYSIPEASGGEEFELELSYGTKFGNDRGYLLLSGGYQDENAIFADDTRPLSVVPIEFDDASTSSNDDFAGETLLPGCEPVNPDGSFNGNRFCLVPSYSSYVPGGTFEGDAWVTRDGVFVNDQGGLTDRAPGRDFFGDFDGFNFRPGRTIEGERKIINLGAHSTWEFATNALGSLTVLYSDIQSETRGSFENLDNGDTGSIASDHPFIPQIVEDTRSGSVSYTRRLVELGRNSRQNDRSTLRIMADMTGTLDNGLDYEAFATYGHFSQEQANPNEVNYRNAADALQIESDGAGGFQCDDAEARARGCVPLNLFGLNSISPEAADYIRYNGFGSQTRDQLTFGGHLTGELFQIKPGAVNFAAGVEFRREEQATIGDPDNNLNLGGQDGDITTDDIDITSLATFPSVNASYEVWEGFAEVQVPIIEDILNVEAAGRIADYNTVGTLFSYDVGAVLTPVDGLKFRGRYARAQRAPNITELFSPPRPDADTVNGPCNDLMPDGTGLDPDGLEGTGGENADLAVVLANCLASPGIQAFFADPDNAGEAFDDDGSIQGPNAGNPNVGAETANTLTLGAVIQPNQIPGLTVIVDYYRIEIDDAITALSSQDTIDLCYAAADFPNNQFCDLVTRDALGQIEEILNPQQNLQQELVEGIDASLRYRFEVPSVPGDWDLDLRYSHYFKEQTSFVGIGGVELVSTFLGEIQNPDDEFRAKMSYELGNARLSYTMTFEKGGVDDINNHPNPGDDRYFQVDNEYFHRIYGRYDFGPDDNYRIYGGVNNITNNFGAFLPSGTRNGSSSNIVSDLARPVGREFYVGARVRF